MTKELRCLSCNRPYQRASSDAATRPGVPKAVPPFCSERCKLVDLSRWLGEEYTVSSPSLVDPADTWEIGGPSDEVH